MAGLPCSSGGQTDLVVEQPELPAPVAATRQAIIDAATRCDFPALTAMAEQVTRFEYSNLWLHSGRCPATISAEQRWAARQTFPSAVVKGDQRGSGGIEQPAFTSRQGGGDGLRVDQPAGRVG